MDRQGCRNLAVIFAFLAVLAATGCAKNDKKSLVLPSADWEVWNDPGLVLALDVTDPIGDHLGFSLEADWALMQGTYDTDYIYIRVDVHSSPQLNDTGGVYYRVIVDANNSGGLDGGDYVLSWNYVDGFNVLNHLGGPANVYAYCNLDPAGGIYFAIARYLVNPVVFGLRAEMLCWQLTDFVPGDIMPDSGGMESFVFP